MLVVNAPANVVYARLEYQIQQARWAILSFTSLQTFAGWLVAVRWLVVTIYFAVALLIAWRKWNDWFALFVSGALLLLAWGFVMRSDNNTWLYPRLLLQVVPAASFILAQLPLLGLVLLFFLFPDGRFAPRWHKWLAFLSVLATVLFFYSDENRLVWRDYRPILEQWAWLIWVTLLLVALLMALVGQVYRYRRVAIPAQRQQMKWVLFGLAAILSIPLLSWPLQDTGGAWGALAAIGLELAVMAFLPITIGFSILRYRLWDVDLLINRTLVFGGLTLLVAAVYVLVVGLFGVLFQTRANLLLSILATGLIAILLNPLRQRLQQGVNRLMYGERDDPVTVLVRLGERLEHTAVPSESLPVIVETITQALKLPYVAIAAQKDEGSGARPEFTEETKDEIVAAHGRAVEPVTTFPLAYQGQRVGQLIVASRGPGEAFTTAEMRLLRTVARQAGAAVYAAQLTTRLQRSRQRLVAAREEERRRIRRDLHDGLGPQLATLTLKVDAAQNLLPNDPAAAGQLLAEIKAQSQDAVREIRRVVEGLRPPVLDQLGLVTALRECAAQHSNGRLRVTVEAPEPLPLLPAAVEVATYLIAAEAMTNAARHARAQSCTVGLKVREKLLLEIHDDGIGLAADYQAGVGLSSMRERTAELGGRCRVDSRPGTGTHIVVTIPLYPHSSEPQ